MLAVVALYLLKYNSIAQYYNNYYIVHVELFKPTISDVETTNKKKEQHKKTLSAYLSHNIAFCHPWHQRPVGEDQVMALSLSLSDPSSSYLIFFLHLTFNLSFLLQMRYFVLL
jgi:hypothetical protein